MNLKSKLNFKRLPLETKSTQKIENRRLGCIKSPYIQQSRLRGYIRTSLPPPPGPPPPILPQPRLKCYSILKVTRIAQWAQVYFLFVRVSSCKRDVGYTIERSDKKNKTTKDKFISTFNPHYTISLHVCT